MLVLGLELGRMTSGASRLPAQTEGVSRAQLEVELRRIERAIEREFVDQGDKYKTLAGRVDKRLAVPSRKPQDEPGVNGEGSSMGGKIRAREKARRLGFPFPVLAQGQHSVPSRESPTPD